MRVISPESDHHATATTSVRKSVGHLRCYRRLLDLAWHIPYIWFEYRDSEVFSKACDSTRPTHNVTLCDLLTIWFYATYSQCDSTRPPHNVIWSHSVVQDTYGHMVAVANMYFFVRIFPNLEIPQKIARDTCTVVVNILKCRKMKFGTKPSIHSHLKRLSLATFESQVDT